MANPVSKFFSAALEAAQNLKQKRGTAEQMRSMLLQGGAKQKELDYIGLDRFMKHWGSRKDRLGPSVDDNLMQDQLVDYIDKHQVKPEEVLKRGAGNVGEDELRHDMVTAIIRGDQDKYRELSGGFPFDEEILRLKRDYEQATSRSQQDSIRDELFSYVPFPEGVEGNTRWSQYVTGEPSDKYTEHLVTLPVPKGTNPNNAASPGYEDLYQSPHWEEPNVLAHMRYDYDPDALRLEEIQSDWLQQAREKGFKFTPEEAAEHTRRQQDASGAYVKFTEDLRKKYGFSASPYRPVGSLSQDVLQFATPEEYQRYIDLSNEWTDLKNKTAGQQLALPRAPLANMNDWTTMMVRRAMLEAAENDKSKLRWTSGALQDRRYSPNPGRRKYYDEVIPSIVKKIAKPYGDVQVVPNNSYRPNPMHEVELPRPLIEALQKRGKVPFFKYGGEVE